MVVQTGMDLSCCGEKLASYAVLMAVASTVHSWAMIWLRGAIRQIDPPKDWPGLLWARGLLMSGGFRRELNEQGKIEVSIVCAGHSGRLASFNLNAVKECQRGHARKASIASLHGKPIQHIQHLRLDRLALLAFSFRSQSCRWVADFEIWRQLPNFVPATRRRTISWQNALLYRVTGELQGISDYHRQEFEDIETADEWTRYFVQICWSLRGEQNVAEWCPKKVPFQVQAAALTGAGLFLAASLEWPIHRCCLEVGQWAGTQRADDDDDDDDDDGQWLCTRSKILLYLDVILSARWYQ